VLKHWEFIASKQPSLTHFLSQTFKKEKGERTLRGRTRTQTEEMENEGPRVRIQRKKLENALKNSKNLEFFSCVFLL
jgi:hypothetical protein